MRVDVDAYGALAVSRARAREKALLETEFGFARELLHLESRMGLGGFEPLVVTEPRQQCPVVCVA